jgi:hypothetical protein
VDAVADAVALHKPEDVLHEPARIAKLDDVGVPLQRDSQEALELRQVGPPTGGKLVEHRAKDFAQLVSPLILLTLDQPQAQPLKVARRQLVEREFVGCPGDGRLGHHRLLLSRFRFLASS